MLTLETNKITYLFTKNSLQNGIKHILCHDDLRNIIKHKTAYEIMHA